MGTPLNNSMRLGPNSESPADVHVLHARRLRAGVSLSDTAKFDDDEWPIAPAVLQRQGRRLTLRFNSVSKNYTQVLKLVTYAALSGRLPPNEPRPSIATTYSIYFNLAVFLRWLESNHPSLTISEITADVLTQYQHHLLTARYSPDRRAYLRLAVAYLWRYRDALSSDALRLDPRMLSSWKERHTPQVENSTSRIPEEVHGRLLVWAMRFVTDFSDDIVTALNRWEELRAPRTRQRLKRQVTEKRVLDYLADAQRNRQPLPGINGQVTLFAIARIIGCDRLAVREHEVAITEAARSLGVSPFAYLGIDVTGRLEGKTWIQGISVDPSRDDSIFVVARILQTACYIVIAFLSGMRDSEIKHLTRGCCTAHLDGNGQPYRWTVSSLAFKGETDPSGVPATWVVGEPAAQAIAVLERIQPDRDQQGTDILFAPVRCGGGFAASGRDGNTAITSSSTGAQLNKFLSWVNSYGLRNGREDTIPDVNGRPWKLTTRQFRRTLAWYIARRPGGSIAGAIAYRHHGIQMFEGYAGTSASGFRAEVESEQALARGEDLLALIDRHEHTSLSGPAADEAQSRLENMARTPGFTGTVTTDRRRLLRLISAHEPAVYPGKYVTCVYTHEKALCRSGQEPTPDPSHCKPLTCRNVALTSENFENWNHELAELEQRLKSPPPLPPALEARLRARQSEIIKFIDRNQNR